MKKSTTAPRHSATTLTAAERVEILQYGMIFDERSVRNLIRRLRRTVKGDDSINLLFIQDAMISLIRMGERIDSFEKVSFPVNPEYSITQNLS